MIDPLEQAVAIARQARQAATASNLLDAATVTAKKAKWERGIQDVREGLADFRRLLWETPLEDRRPDAELYDVMTDLIERLPPEANCELLPDYRKTVALLRQRRDP